MLFRGINSKITPHPYSPILDRLIGTELRKRGHSGDRSKAVFASTLQTQSLDYALDADNVFILTPHDNSIVTWFENVGDVTLNFESFLGEAIHRRTAIKPRSLLEDVRGDICIFEQYASHNVLAFKRFVNSAIRSYLDEVSVKEHRFSDIETLRGSLGGHRGEVWVTGTYDLFPTNKPDPIADGLYRP